LFQLEKNTKMKTLKSIIMTAIIATVVTTSGTAGNGEGSEKTIHVFPALGYAFNALEPWIDAQTMEIHYTKHHRAYFDNFMAAAKDAGLLETPLTEIFAQMSKYSPAIRNNGGGLYNHTLFWQNMTGEKQEVPAELKAAIEKDLGSWDAFKTAFETAAKTRFGSGWAWLSVGSDGKLFVSSTPNQDNPLMDVAEKKGKPLLALDVWEHAYYLKYQNRRPEYVGNFWNVVNWKVVADRYKKAVGQ
jgi:Fe-Mn family superoxide dismutase